MAQFNITLKSEEILEVFTRDRNEALIFLFERILNEILQIESEEQLGASFHERSQDRKDYRNGTRERDLTTRIGRLSLQVPRHRNKPFHTMVFESYKRSEAALITTMVQMVVSGVSTRKVAKVVETLCGETPSKSTVSELCKRLDKEISAFRDAPLHEVDAPFLMIDATYFKARENHKIVSKAFMVALAIKGDGRREVVGFDVYNAEDKYSWAAFLGNLNGRGLKSVQMVISDAHKAIRSSIAEVYPQTAWQRCQVHFLRNILNATPPKYKEGLKLELREMFSAQTIKGARKRRDEIIEDYAPVAEKAMQVLEDGFEDSMTVMNLPPHMRMILRSTNILERLNRELKRRSDAIQVFPNKASVLRLMGAVTMEYSEAQGEKNRIYLAHNFQQIRERITKEYKEIAKRQMALLKTA